MPVPPAVTFALGTLGVLVVLALAWFAATSDSVPLIGSVRSTLIVVVIVGMAACAVAGISEAPVIGWTHPISIIGIALGVVALVIAAAGLFGWDGILSPIGAFVPTSDTLLATSERLAVVGLAGVVALKWLVNLVLAIGNLVSR